MKNDLKDHHDRSTIRHWFNVVARCVLRPMTRLYGCLIALIILVLSIPGTCWKNIKGWSRRKSDIELGSVDTKSEKSSEWTFWGIYINHGLKGSLINLFLLNPIAIVMILSEFAINTLNTYATTVITKTLTTMSQPVTRNNEQTLVTPLAPSVTVDVSMTLIYFAFLLIGVLFATDISNYIKRWTRPRSTVYKDQITERIKTKVISQMEKASHETDKEHGIDDKAEALSRFMWVYDNITDTLIDAAVQTTRSLALCAYIIYQEPVIFFVLLIVYSVVWRYVIPYINKKKKKTDSGQKFWERAYYDLSVVGNAKINPLYNQLYRDDDVELGNVNGIIDIENVAKMEVGLTKDDVIVRPNVVKRYMETIRYYSSKNANWNDSYEILQITQHIIIGFILISMFYTRRFETAIVILINYHTMFSMINTFSNLSRIEQNAGRSIEPLQKILDAVDKQLEDNARLMIHIPTQLISSSKTEIRRHVRSVRIDNMKILIPAQKALKKESFIETDETENKELVPKPVEYDRYVYLESGRIDYEIGKVLLLEGVTGCGKSVTINAITGLYTKNICKSMMIDFSDGSCCESEFNSILGSRCYVSQLLSDEYKFNGKITLPLFKLFPGARDIGEITNFLVDVFALKPASVPESLTDHPHSKLSGGELQRYVVATQIWRVLRIKPDMLVLDEVDRALDKETAVKVMSWIITNVKCFFVIVTHLTEVKQMLMDKRCVSQVWTYESSESDKQQIKIVPHIIE